MSNKKTPWYQLHVRGAKFRMNFRGPPVHVPGAKVAIPKAKEVWTEYFPCPDGVTLDDAAMCVCKEKGWDQEPPTESVDDESLGLYRWLYTAVFHGPDGKAHRAEFDILIFIDFFGTPENPDWDLTLDTQFPQSGGKMLRELLWMSIQENPVKNLDVPPPQIRICLDGGLLQRIVHTIPGLECDLRDYDEEGLEGLQKDDPDSVSQDAAGRRYYNSCGPSIVQTTTMADEDRRMVETYAAGGSDW